MRFCGGVLLPLLLLLQQQLGATVSAITFEPLSQPCLPLAVDDIDHCCICLGCGVNNVTSGDGSLSVVTDRFDVTPAGPSATANLGSSMAVNPAGTRIVADTFPSGLGGDQTVGVDTSVFVVELSTVTPGTFTSVAVTTVPASRGHTLAASDMHFAAGGTVDFPIVNSTAVDTVNTVALFVKTVAPPWSSLFEVTNPVNNTEFGYALAIEGALLAVGSPGFSNATGRVYVYDTFFGLLETVVSSTVVTPTDDLRFGHSVLLTGSLMFVGAPGEDSVTNTTDLGAVYVYERNSTTMAYTFLLKVLPPNVTANRGFGWSLAVCDGFLVVGSKDSDLVEVYKEDTANITASTHHQSLTAPGLPLPSTFGQSVAIQCNLTAGVGRIAVGDTMFPTSASARGKIFTYEYQNSTDTWVPCQPLADTAGSFTTRFGQRVALTPAGGASGTLLVAAAPDTDSGANGSGALWVFDLDREAQCTGCDNVTNSCSLDDQCGVCGGNDTVCAGCDGVPNSGLVVDFCGVCAGTNTTCINVTNIIDIAPSVGVTGNFSINATCNVGTNFQLIPEPQANGPFTWLLTAAASFGTVTIDPDDDEDSIPEFADDDDEEIEYLSMELMPPLAGDAFDLQVTDSFGNTATTTVNVTLLACVGCDNVTNSGMVFDACNVCGGNGTSCLDCAGDAFGTKVVDFCGACVEPGVANATCFVVFDRPNATVPCLTIIEIENATWAPGFPDDRLHWDIVAPLPVHGVTAIGDLTGKITYAHTGTVNATDVVAFQAENPEGLFANATVVISIGGCGPVGCDGVPGSGVVFDLCGVCNGINACVDCAGVPFGNATLDLCSVCQGNNTCLDCAGTPFGPLVNDSCGVCGGDNSTCADCAGVPFGNATLDLCAVCQGNNSCLDCNGAPFGGAVIDQCGVCGGNDSCVDCSGVPFGNATLDLCAVCQGNNSCVDCNGTPFGGAVIDQCGVCGGNDSCVDCGGVPFGNATLDLCAVCQGNNSCVDCNGTPFGGLVVDLCGLCGGANACVDCAGVPFGNATADVCGTCQGVITDPNECPSGGVIAIALGGALVLLFVGCGVLAFIFFLLTRRTGQQQQQQPGFQPILSQMEDYDSSGQPSSVPPISMREGSIARHRVLRLVHVV